MLICQLNWHCGSKKLSNYVTCPSSSSTHFIVQHFFISLFHIVVLSLTLVTMLICCFMAIKVENKRMYRMFFTKHIKTQPLRRGDHQHQDQLLVIARYVVFCFHLKRCCFQILIHKKNELLNSLKTIKIIKQSLHSIFVLRKSWISFHTINAC